MGSASSITDDVVVEFYFPSGSSSTGWKLNATSNDQNAGSVNILETGNENEYLIIATPNPGYAFDHWEYRISVDGETWDDGWAVYEALTAANGTVILTGHTQFRAHFSPAAVSLGNMQIGTVSEISDPQWAPIAADIGINKSGLFASDLERSVLGNPSPGEAAKLVFQWYPVGIIQTPSGMYYNDHDAWAELNEADFTTVSLALYAGGDTNGDVLFNRTISLWLNGDNATPTTISGEGPYYAELTFIMPDSGQLTLSMALNGGTPSVKTLTVYDDTQYQAVKNLGSYYTTTFGTNPAGAENLPNKTYQDYADVRILLENAYTLGRDSIAAAAGEDAVNKAYEAAMERLDQLKTLQTKIDAGDGEWYQNVNGVLKIAVNTNGADFAYVPTLAYENTTRSFDSISSDQARAYIALTASLEAAYPGIWTIRYGGLPDPYDVYITSISTSSGDGTAVQGSATGGTVYTLNSGYANGFSIQPVNDRDAIRVGSMEAGNFPVLDTRPDKDDLLWAVAAAKEQIPLATLEASEAYQNALLNLRGWDAYGCNIETPKEEQQAIIDAALDALMEAFPDANLERYPVSAKAKAVMKLIRAIGTVTLESKDAIEAAEAAYEMLTEEQKAEVRNYATLTNARAIYNSLINHTSSKPEAALTGVLNYLAANVNDPAVASMGGEWAVLAMARGGVMSDSAKTAYLTNLNARLEAENPLTQYTDYERITLALSALGINAAEYGETGTDLTGVYKAFTDPSARTEENQNLMADIFALLALNAKPYDSVIDDDGVDARDAYKNRILAEVKNDGGWNHAAGSTKSDVDTTAMAIQALAPYYAESAVKEKVDAAISWLKDQRDPYTSGYGNKGRVNTESTAQVVVALCALEIDPAGADWTMGDEEENLNLLSALTTWYNAASETEGWFGHDSNSFDQMATEQAAYALVAWKRFAENSRSLYDMQDAFGKSSDASLRTFTVCGIDATEGDTAGTWTVELPYDTVLAELTASDLVIKPALGAKNTDPEAADGGATWSFTVTAEDGTTLIHTLTVTLAEAPNAGVKSLSLNIDGATVGEEDENHNFAVVLPFGSEVSALTKDSFIITPAAEGATVSDPETADGGANWTFTITAKDGETQQTYTISVTVSTDNTAQNQADVDAVKEKIPAEMTASGTDVLNDATAKAFVTEELDKLKLDETVARTVKISGFTAAEDGTEANPAGKDGSFIATVTLKKGEGDYQATATAAISVTVKAAAYVDPNTEITVTFRLIGAYPAEGDDKTPDYVTWIPTKTYTITIGSTMHDMFTLAMKDAGLGCAYSDETESYVATIYAPAVLTGYELSEFTNGQNSGWMYTVNGKHPGIGLSGYKFSSDETVVETGKAEVVWHYINDWVLEQEDYSGTTGNVNTWNKWLDAADEAPEAVPATSIELDQTSVSLTEDETVTLTATVTPFYALVTWTSSDEDVATVDENGTVTAVSAGTATITGKAGEKSASCEVEVTAEEVPEANIEYIGGTEEEPIAEVTSTVETTVNDEGVETKTATLNVKSEKTNSEGKVVETPCVVIAVNPEDGSYELLEAKPNEETGGCDFVKENYTEDTEFIVAVKGDYDGDGDLRTLDLALANLEILTNNIDPMTAMIMGSKNGKLRTIDLAMLNLGIINESIEW